ncbi:MAG: hypothetical protein V3U72_04365 [Candidatus Aenigmarchaeota archaeon]
MYQIDTGVSETNGQFWKNFFRRYTDSDINYRLVEGQRKDNKEQFATGFKKSGTGEVYLALSSGTTKNSVEPTANRKQRKESRRYLKEKNLKHIYFDHSHPDDPLPLSSSEDLTHLDVETKRGTKPVHSVTCYHPPTGEVGKVIYQRKNYPNIISRTLSRVSNKTGIKRPFHKRFERNVENRIKSEVAEAERSGVKLIRGDVISMLAEELERTGKYSADRITVNERGVSLPPDFGKYSF